MTGPLMLILIIFQQCDHLNVKTAGNVRCQSVLQANALIKTTENGVNVL